MLASFLITFREGLEAFLIVGIVLTYLTKLDARHYHKLIHAGVLLGALVSVISAFAFQLLIDQFEQERYQHLLMAGILFFATAVLTYMVIWMQKQASQQVSEVQKSLSQLVSTGNLLGLVMLAFLAVLREGMETVLFFSALSISDGETSLQASFLGALAGLVTSVMLVGILFRSAWRIPLKPFFQYTSLLIIIIAAGLLSSAANMLQAAGVLPGAASTLFNIAHILDDRGVMGTFLRALFGYNASPTTIQFSLWLVYLSVFIALWKRNYRHA